MASLRTAVGPSRVSWATAVSRAPRPCACLFSTSLRAANASNSDSQPHHDNVILQKIKDELKAAMKAKQADVTTTLRSILSEHQYSLKSGSATTLVSLLNKAISRRQESASQYTDANRRDLADKEHSEADTLRKFLPAQMGEAEVKKLVEDVVAKFTEQGNETKQGAKEDASMAKKMMGAVMKEVKSQVEGRFEGKKLKDIVDGVLGGGKGK
ncbi:unnamed protein product [Jaminaea pallidilutea]